jgi:hypothetical protein
VKPCALLAEGFFSGRYRPPSLKIFKEAISLDGTIWRVNKTAENRDIPQTGQRGFINAFY